MTATTGALSQKHTQIAPRWLTPARLTWLGLVGLLLGLYVYDIGPAKLAPDLTAAGLAWNVIMPLGFTAIGGVIFWRKSNDWLGLLTSFALIGMGVYLLTGVGSSLKLRPEWHFAASLLEGLTSGSFALLVFLFPDGYFAPRGARPLALAVIALIIAASFVTGLVARPLILNIVGALVAITLAVALQVYRYARLSGPVQRQQTKWVVAGLFSPLLVILAYYLFIKPYQAALNASGALMLFQLIATPVALLLPLAIAISILRYRLWDIDNLINRAVVYGSLTLLLALGYFGAVVVLQAVFQAVAGQARSELVTVLSTLLIAVIAMPLRRRLQGTIDRRFYRRRYDAARTLAGFGATLRDSVDLDQLSDRLVAVVDETMQPAEVSLWIKPHHQ